jgi:exodeoxyribonuclease VII small subunit
MAKKRSDDVDDAAATSGPARVPSRSPRRFEAAVDEIEQIVQRLESGQLDLAQSLEQYSHGIDTLKECHQLLADAERRVTLLSGFDADGNPVTTPIDQAQLGLDNSAGKSARSRKFFGKAGGSDLDGNLEES